MYRVKPWEMERFEERELRILDQAMAQMTREGN